VNTVNTVFRCVFANESCLTMRTPPSYPKNPMSRRCEEHYTGEVPSGGQTAAAGFRRFPCLGLDRSGTAVRRVTRFPAGDSAQEHDNPRNVHSDDAKQCAGDVAKTVSVQPVGAESEAKDMASTLDDAIEKTTPKLPGHLQEIGPLNPFLQNYLEAIVIRRRLAQCGVGEC